MAHSQKVRRLFPRPATAIVTGNVRAEMARKRISQALVADRLRLTQQAVSNRLNGRVPFDVDEIVAVAELLEVDPAALLHRSAS
ncbi:helix-turn-helix domain-containing protein [Cellulomonas uda]|uniref:HTH cro/C1-type domain-containing protein n=1 Tax=Cellulomonas uda TaxID=1714 RepID=A0A4Y3K990_CELUD|nr:helix-turn-helix transcriptional regulator [Cellulomonas uda]NII67789.1 transcriptional regulator with XRE-family HTH domain [Cellulomonas uda]GEA79964.1 hypothetical protein CUD01_04080 [Cellulomonas uda]